MIKIGKILFRFMQDRLEIIIERSKDYRQECDKYRTKMKSGISPTADPDNVISGIQKTLDALDELDPSSVKAFFILGPLADVVVGETGTFSRRREAMWTLMTRLADKVQPGQRGEWTRKPVVRDALMLHAIRKASSGYEQRTDSTYLYMLSDLLNEFRQIHDLIMSQEDIQHSRTVDDVFRACQEIHVPMFMFARGVQIAF